MGNLLAGETARLTLSRTPATAGARFFITTAGATSAAPRSGELRYAR